MRVDILNGCVGLEYAIPAMRNSWSQYRERSDSGYLVNEDGSAVDPKDPTIPRTFVVGENDMKLLHSLVNAGPSHRKLLRMIFCYADVVAPLYWWKQFDTHRIGVEKISESTMHSILVSPFDIGDFERVDISDIVAEKRSGVEPTPAEFDKGRVEFDLMEIIAKLNHYRLRALDDPKNRAMHERVIYSLLPDSYLQRRTVCMNYEAMYNIYILRKGHKLPQWQKFCNAIGDIHEFKELCLYSAKENVEVEK